ncbi:hypothetical protein SRS16CHR_01561 [Variovorax sp. SRS16]|uniref:hypothetical protein n=1 Tax=Variovorax sp. SRS16 TaxID=282217 RepID=UPI001315F1FD|nr:hypothetical protein [Variovorax sp. SRS16]VTU15673.1 hypothetical protein SRS16CHR_01561 [Variovorax sp. SRS16]
MNHVLEQVRRLQPASRRSHWRQHALSKPRRLRAVAAAPATPVDPMAMLESAVQALWREAEHAGRAGLGIEVCADAGQMVINVDYTEPDAAR